MSRFQGDPRLILTANGSTIRFVGGQPIMDAGVENYILISLFTLPGWCGNFLMQTPEQRVGSDFEIEAAKPITKKSQNDVKEAAERALADGVSSGLFASVSVEVTNPTGLMRYVRIIVASPGGELTDILLIQNGLNWLAQATDPAYKKI